MNILLLMVSKAEGTGGMEKHCQELANGLLARGHNVTCATSIQHQSQLREGVKTVTLNTKTSRFSPSLLFTIMKVINEGHFDIVHAQGSKAAAILQWLTPVIPRVKLVATIHNFKSAYPKASAFNRIIAVSKKLAADIGHSNVTVVYNGIAPPQPHAMSKPLPANLAPPVWLAVGRLVSAKGFDFLIDAFQNVDGSLLIAGSGPDHKRLEQQIQNTSQQGKVILLGHREDIPALMAVADGVVISSRREGFSYVFAEALLAGKPVIATDVPIANEFLDPQFIHGEFIPKEFANLLMTNTDKIRQQQSPTRKKAEGSLLLKNMIENTINVYSECLIHAEIDLSNQKPFASGSNRHCYRHPEIPGRCLKVIRPENIEARYQRQQPLKKMLGKSRLNDNKQEQLAHQQSAIMSLIRQGHESIVWQHLPRFYGETSTSLGPANESEMLLDEQGSPAQTLESYLQEYGFDAPIKAASERFCKWLEATNILTRNLLPHNLVIAQRHNQPELFLVDGLGAPNIQNRLSAVPAWRQRYISRRISRFHKRIEWELSDKKQSWEASQKL